MKNIKKYIYSIMLLLFCATGSIPAQTQTQTQTVTGTVTDATGEALIGVSISVKNEPGLGTVTNVEGKYSIKAPAHSVLIFTYFSFQRQEVPIQDRKVVDVVMLEDEGNVLEEVVVTGAGTQKKVSVTGAITSVDIKALKTPTSNITNALAGNIAGVIAMQTSGEPGSNSSEFWIRGISTFGGGDKALILVDGFERPFNEINIEDIETFSVLKDASATAIYGSRGANGVILVTTKKGQPGKINIQAKAEYGYNTRTRTPEFVDGNTYATMLNEALTTRNLEPRYTASELEIIKHGLDPDLYPNVDWKNLLLRDGSNTYRASLTMDGGGTTARYFVSASYLDEGGMYKTDDKLKDYDTNSSLNRWNYRMNVDIDITPSTLLRTGVSGFLERQNRAGLAQTVWETADGGSAVGVNTDGVNIWESLVGQTPIATPVIYSNGLVPAYGTGVQTNPWVLATQSGYKEYWNNKVETNVTLEQNFDFITEGLRFVGRFAFDANNKNSKFHVKWPEQYNTQRRRDSRGRLVMRRVSEERTMTQSSSAWGERVYNLEADLSYGRRFGDHNVSMFVKYAQREQDETSNVGDNIQRGIPRRDQSLSGRVTYDYNSRYLFEFNGGYTGSEVFKTGHQFGFFPAVSVGWNIGEEAFVKDNVSWIDMLKLRYSYGQVGNNKIKRGNDEIRFPYLETIADMDGYNYGDYGQSWTFSGLHFSEVAPVDLAWEVATKHNLGVDIHLFADKFSGTVDVYRDTRSNIYMQRSHLSSMVGITSQPWANVGKTQNEGIDGQFNVTHRVGEVDLTMRGNFTYYHNEVLEYDEEANALPYKMTQGYRVNQAKGLIALGLFEDFQDIKNSPKQTFGAYLPGDIKYKDVNGDGLINDDDAVAVGATRTPSLIYGIGASAAWKGFDFNVHFQGAGKSAYFLEGIGVQPFRGSDWGNILTDAGDSNNRWIAREISGDPATERADAKYPRLSYGGNANNYRYSTFWLRDGAYLRFKTLELGYSIPKQYTNKLKMNTVRVHFIGSNLFVWDTLKLWDPELGSGDGMKYPITKSFTVGLTVNL